MSRHTAATWPEASLGSWGYINQLWPRSVLLTRGKVGLQGEGFLHSGCACVHACVCLLPAWVCKQVWMESHVNNIYCSFTWALFSTHVSSNDVNKGRLRIYEHLYFSAEILLFQEDVIVCVSWLTFWRKPLNSFNWHIWSSAQMWSIASSVAKCIFVHYADHFLIHFQVERNQASLDFQIVLISKLFLPIGNYVNLFQSQLVILQS